MQFKNLKAGFEDAKYRCKMADKHLSNVLEQMVKADMAKIVPDQDDIWMSYIVGEKRLLDQIRYIEFEGEDYRYMGIDEGGMQEAKEQGCDPEEFLDEIVLAPGEKIEWFFKEARP